MERARTWPLAALLGVLLLWMVLPEDEGGTTLAEPSGSASSASPGPVPAEIDRPDFNQAVPGTGAEVAAGPTESGPRGVLSDIPEEFYKCALVPVFDRDEMRREYEGWDAPALWARCRELRIETTKYNVEYFQQREARGENYLIELPLTRDANGEIIRDFNGDPIPPPDGNYPKVQWPDGPTQKPLYQIGSPVWVGDKYCMRFDYMDPSIPENLAYYRNSLAAIVTMDLYSELTGEWHSMSIGTRDIYPELFPPPKEDEDD